MLVRFGVAALLLSLPVWCAEGRAQLAPSPDAPPVSTAPAQASGNETATLKLNVNLVNVFFTVKDKDGRLVPHLTRDDCTVTEDEAPQKLKSFTAETSLPLTLGILLDTSGSQYRVLSKEQQAGDKFLEQVLKAKDEAFLLTFDVNVDLLQDITGDVQLLTRGMNKAEINTAGGNGAGGSPGAGGGTIPAIGKVRGTLLYDAVYLAGSNVMTEVTGRKAMILLTDGQDEGSKTKIGEAIAAAQKANVPVYVILIADRSFYADVGFGDLGYKGFSAMKKMTEETGGRLIDVGSNSKKLEEAFQQIEDELRTEYAASYAPSNAVLDGGFRRLGVECRGDGLRVQVRKGYFALGTRE
ncbi:MAG: VWA domain-containing protein [Terracidiphilus sp.]|jgi:VWFA-related protein